MILYRTLNRRFDLWYLDRAGHLARPPAAPAVYALVSFEGASPSYYVGSSRHLAARMSAHLSFARSVKLRGQSAGGRHLAPVVAKRRRALVLILETCAGADRRRLHRHEQAWMLAAWRDAGPQALTDQMLASSNARGPAILAARRHWPSPWVEALAGFFREPRRPAPAAARALPRPASPAAQTVAPRSAGRRGRTTP